MQANVKSGTRCGCRDYNCARIDVENEQHRCFDQDECQRDAVRMVTVRERLDGPPNPRAKVWTDRDVPMCEACAAYHEAQQK